MKYEDLELAVFTVARAVHEFGDKYLPIFELLHKEQELFKQRMNSKSLASQIALGYSKSIGFVTQTCTQNAVLEDSRSNKNNGL